LRLSSRRRGWKVGARFLAFRLEELPMSPLRTLLNLAVAAAGLGLVACGEPASHSPAPAATPAAAAAPTPPPPAAAPSVADLVGARASSGESEFQARGYTPARTRGLTAYWWHASGTCVRAVTANGRYATVAAARPADCGH
jgi:hypothetical protein